MERVRLREMARYFRGISATQREAHLGRADVRYRAFEEVG
jgi:hypothetical protein